MPRHISKLILALVVLCQVVSAQQTEQAAPIPQPAISKPVKEHEWLKNFSGSWTVRSRETGSAKDNIGTMTGRMLGGLWVVNEIRADAGGSAMNGIQTIGYDETKKKYVGTWVDNMMNHLWVYEGTLDAAEKVLTLEADGPVFGQPGKTTQYRDVYELKSADEITVTSSMKGSDGKWTTFATGEMKRANEDKK